MTEAPLHPAGFWQRYAAWSMDAAIVAVPVLLLDSGRLHTHLQALVEGFVSLTMTLAQRLVDGLMQGTQVLQLASSLAHEPALQAAMAGLAHDLGALLLPPLAWSALLAAIYWITFERSPWQATPGKRALGLRSSTRDGQALGWGRAAGRHFAAAPSWLLLNLGHALAAWTPQKRALHDYLAGTRVSVIDTTGDQRLPWWAKAWLLLQVLAALALTAWFYLSLLEALQSTINGA